MEQNRASITAVITAYVRAYHAMNDHPKVFDDFLAPQLFTEPEKAFFAKNLASTLAFLDPELAAGHPDEASALACVLRLQSAPISLPRARYTEEFLESAVRQGVQQYVILGAGLDTFAFRRPDLLDRLQVFAVDQPATQAEMRRRIAAAGWKEPAALHWVPVDFSRQNLAASLQDSPYDTSKATLFSWLGVTYYLALNDILDTLRSLARLARPGSSIIFDYHEAAAFDPERADKILKRVQEIVKTAGEPMKTGFDPAGLGALLSPLGWRLAENLGPAEIEERYFKGRTDGYHALPQTGIARAEIRQ